MSQLKDDAIESLLKLNTAPNEMLLLCNEQDKHDGPALAAIRILANDVIARARRR